MASWSKGTIKKWDDDAGYGFIAPHNGGSDVFFHISALANRQRRPTGNEIVAYKTEADNKGRGPRAAKVHYGSAPSSPLRTHIVFPIIFLVAVALAALAGKVPVWLPGVYLLASLVTFTLYGFDKARAKRRQWRIPEGTLHLWELVGGWPGALIAQQRYRHKTKKLSFKLIVWLIIILHVGILGWWIYAGPQSILQILGQHQP